jgi:hypothetical protein
VKVTGLAIVTSMNVSSSPPSSVVENDNVSPMGSVGGSGTVVVVGASVVVGLSLVVAGLSSVVVADSAMLASSTSLAQPVANTTTIASTAALTMVIPAPFRLVRFLLRGGWVDLHTVDGIAHVQGNYPLPGVAELAAWVRDSEGSLIGIGGRSAGPRASVPRRPWLTSS